MKRFLALAPLLLLGCGHRAIVEFSAPDATRDADGHVTVAVTAHCRPMLGIDDCGAICVNAAWLTAPGSVAARANVCDPRVMSRGERTRVALRSDRPIPKSSRMYIRIDATATHRGPWQAYPIELPNP